MKTGVRSAGLYPQLAIQILTSHQNGVKELSPNTVFANVGNALRTSTERIEAWARFGNHAASGSSTLAVRPWPPLLRKEDGISRLLISSIYLAGITKFGVYGRLWLLDVDWDPATLTWNNRPTKTGRSVKVELYASDATGVPVYFPTSPAQFVTGFSFEDLFGEYDPDEGPFFGFACEIDGTAPGAADTYSMPCPTVAYPIAYRFPAETKPWA